MPTLHASSSNGAQPPRRLRIGRWQVDPDLNQIRRGTEVVRLEPKGMAVLLHLAGRPGAVASRDELLAAAWPGVVVGDNALTQVVIKLRKALGDTAREPAYIEAISKKGYRLIASVETADDAVDREVRPVPTGSAPVRGSLARTSRWAGVALATGLVAGAVWWMHDAGRRSDAALPSQTPAAASPRDALPTVIVQPFEALGTEALQLLIARAITADLVTDLSKVPGIWVVSGSAPSAPANRDAARLPAHYVLSGTVQRDGDRLRLHVRLAERASGRQLWSERFDRDVKDLFTVQDQLVQQINAVLPVKLSQAETQRLAQRYTRNIEAYEHFVRGQGALLVRRRAQNELAREQYRKAIQADPAFSRAYAGLALTHALDYQQGWAADGPAALARALEIAETAKQISPDLPEAHWVLGFVHTQRRQHDEALRHLDAALRLNPSYADAYALKGGVQTYIGRPAEALPLLRTALRLNPGAGSLYFLLLGRAYYFVGDAEQSRINLEQALARNAENLEARLYLAASCLLAKQSQAAAWQVDEIRALEPHFEVRSWLASYPMTDAGQKERLVRALAELGLN